MQGQHRDLLVRGRGRFCHHPDPEHELVEPGGYVRLWSSQVPVGARIGNGLVW